MEQKNEAKKITEFGENEYVEFFEWLFDKQNIKIEKEIDISSCLEKEEPYIYYTPEIKAFFETSAMKRIGMIGQLANVSIQNPNSSHTRLDHCKGAYQKILEFYIKQYKKTSWKNTHSDKESKLKVLADIMDMASHDIGHNICSHALEKLIGSKKGAHEVLGNRILHENKELIQALNNINPKLLQTLDTVKKENYGLHTLKEGNIDFDRADFLVRDSIYLGVETGFDEQKIENSNTILELLDKITNGCDMYKINFNGKEMEVPVFSYEVEPEIEQLLERRVENYENIYNSVDNKPKDVFLEEFCRALLETSDVDNDLKRFIEHLAETDVENIDIDEYLSWNDIRFYNSIFDIVENCNNENIKRLAKNCLPNKECLVSLIYNRIFPHIKPKIDENGNEVNIEDEFEYEEERKFYLSVKKIVKDEKTYKEFMKDKNLEECMFKTSFPNKEQLEKFSSQLQTEYFISEETIQKLKVWETKIKVYNPKEPIFIKGKDDKIYTLDEYPERKLNFENVEYCGITGIKDKMMLEGVKETEIQKCQKAFDEANTRTRFVFLYNNKGTKLNSELQDIASKKQSQFER